MEDRELPGCPSPSASAKSSPAVGPRQTNQDRQATQPGPWPRAGLEAVEQSVLQDVETRSLSGTPTSPRLSITPHRQFNAPSPGSRRQGLTKRMGNALPSERFPGRFVIRVTGTLFRLIYLNQYKILYIRLQYIYI